MSPHRSVHLEPHKTLLFPGLSQGQRKDLNVMLTRPAKSEVCWWCEVSVLSVCVALSGLSVHIRQEKQVPSDTNVFTEAKSVHSLQTDGCTHTRAQIYTHTHTHVQGPPADNKTTHTYMFIRLHTLLIKYSILHIVIGWKSDTFPKS